MENVVDTSQSRVKMVNNTIECDASTYSEAIPVVLNTSGQEQPIKAYLTASSFKRMFCFFELPASLPIAVSELQPSLSLIVDDAYIQHMLSIGHNYVLCYVGSADTTRVFNKIGSVITVKDIILALEKEQRFSMTVDDVSHLVPAPVQVTGDWFTMSHEVFDTSVNLSVQLSVLLRYSNPKPDRSGSEVKITTVVANAVNIQRMPLGVAPQAYVWCKHSKSLVVYPEDGAGVAVTLGVLAAPSFQYSILSNPATQVILARNVSFPTLAVLWSSAGFPAYYFDEVAFTITPTLPDGLDISSQNGAALAQIVII
ncbi:Alpha-agarase [Durusdinium trenchii]|uniref:Alpha-agarase n=1 Tax=Durusdinium trenchii TaxID=1381693 RepID=A0ABP0SBT2_9DINO